MAVRDVTTYLVDASTWLPKQFIFCRVEDEDGTVGWGEAYTIPQRERGIAEFVKGLGTMLLSLDEATPENYRQNVTSWYDEGHLSIDFSSAASALEVALWDIRGKQAGKPVCELLGTVQRRSIPLYANMDPETPGETMDQLVERCHKLRALGYDAIKIYPMNYEPLDRAVECVSRVRDVIGNDARLMIDVWALQDADEALAAAREFAAFDPFWFEEPVAGERLAEMAAIRREVDIPIVTGERQVGLHHYRSALEQEAADILNPDIVAAGGIQDMLETAKLAASYDVSISPHCWNSTLIATAAMIHTMAVIPNAIIGEYFPQYASFFDQFGELAFDLKQGAAMIGDTPGLGVNMRDDALADYRI
ncbi:MAG: mandelate racemase/muconate lactonizing enzyme family protein [Pseudomonadota bacterium]